MLVTLSQSKVPTEFAWCPKYGFVLETNTFSGAYGRMVWRKGAFELLLQMSRFPYDPSVTVRYGSERARDSDTVWTATGWWRPGSPEPKRIINAACPQDWAVWEETSIQTRLVPVKVERSSDTPIPSRNESLAVVRGLKLCALGYLAGKDLIRNASGWKVGELAFTPLNVWANKNKAVFQTTNDPGIGALTLGDKTLRIALGRPLSLKASDRPRGVLCSKDGVWYAPVKELERWKASKGYSFVLQP